MKKNEPYNTKIYHVLGLMSGTSVDGIDLAFAKFTETKPWSYEILAAETFAYATTWQDRLTQAIDLDKDQLAKLDREYTALLAEASLDFIRKHKIKNLHAICSHGHTIFHQPAQGVTVQIGNNKELATLTGQTVICDFRVEDVALGGQGAPLVPIGDKLLFGDHDICLNIGGFANASFEQNGQRIAFDICPTNIVLNAFAKKLGSNYDASGKIAASNEVDDRLLAKLNDLPFYIQKPPKSLGLEWVKKEILPLLEASQCTNEVVIATFTEHMAQQIARVLSQTGFGTKKPNVLITGGGAYNEYLIKRLGFLSENDITLPSRELIEFKEALIFGLMGVLKSRGEINVLKSVTGASKDHSAGIVFKV